MSISYDMWYMYYDIDMIYKEIATYFTMWYKRRWNQGNIKGKTLDCFGFCNYNIQLELRQLKWKDTRKTNDLIRLSDMKFNYEWYEKVILFFGGHHLNGFHEYFEVKEWSRCTKEWSKEVIIKLSSFSCKFLIICNNFLNNYYYDLSNLDTISNNI